MECSKAKESFASGAALLLDIEVLRLLAFIVPPRSLKQAVCLYYDRATLI
jgi:hypothetical protein